MCWYCNKELIEPITSYTRKHNKKNKRIELTVHLACYSSIDKTRKRYLLRANNSTTQ